MSKIQEALNALEEVKQAINAAYADGYKAGSKPSEWIGLTDEQKLSLEIQGGKSDVMLAELVEGWLKEKNS
jgi:hypothetical protein